MGGFRQNPPRFKKQAKLPRSPVAHALRFIDDHGVEQASSSHSLDERRSDRFDRRTEVLSENLSAVSEVLFDEDIKCRDRDGASKGVPGEGNDHKVRGMLELDE